MVLDVYIDNRMIGVQIPDSVLEQGESFYQKMDRDMDAGWRMGPTFVENPDTTTRAKIAADKLLGALESDNGNMAALMAGYIVTRLENVSAVRIDTQGEPMNTEFIQI